MESAAQATPQQVTMSLDQDLITFVKAAIWVAGAFLAIFAFIAIGFFGWDVAQTRKVMQDARDDVTKRMSEIRQDHQALKDLKERLEKLGAELVEQIEKKAPPTDSAALVPPPTSTPVPQPAKDGEDTDPEGPLASVWETEEEKRNRIRYVIAWGEFEWTTLPTLAKKAGLSQKEVRALATDDPSIQVGTGRHGQLLFRLKEFNHVYPNDARGNRTLDEWKEIIRQSAHEGKGPASSKILGGH